MRPLTLRRSFSIGLLALTLAVAPGTFGVPDFTDGTDWLNGAALAPRDLAGKVVLVDFWEYTCVNCLRTLPYLRAWYARYRADGFVIVGVHTPEFGFSGETKNVADATRRLQITWPVVLDTNQAIWKRYGNAAWPNEYLFDQDGRLVETVTGEGHYQETEAKIQALLKAANPRLTLPPVMALLPQDSYAKPGAVCYLHTPEVLLEKTKIANAGTSGDRRGDAGYRDPGAPYADGAIYLDGRWQRASDAVRVDDVPATLVLRYHAVQVVGVLSPPPGGGRVDVTQDGAPIAKADAGADVRYDAGGMSYVSVDASRAYEIVMNAMMGAHVLRITPAVPGIGIYSFAFESCEAA